ncbi:MAG: VOC family protein [Thermoleophilia bacterium]
MAVYARIAPCLWFDGQAEEAARLYTSIFPNSRLTAVTRYSEAGQEYHRRRPGSVMVVEFELDGQRFTALNGGPLFTFSEAISLMIFCETQDEIDHYWEKLGADGDPAAQQCGWLKDRFGVSWQVVPAALDRMMTDSDADRVARVTTAMMPMKKLDIAALERAFAGE